MGAFVALNIGYAVLPDGPQDFAYDSVQAWALALVSIMAVTACPPRKLYARAALLILTLYHLDIALTDELIPADGFLASQTGMFIEAVLFASFAALGIWRLVVASRERTAPDFARSTRRHGGG